MEQGKSVSYKVLYAKAGAKKRKLFADGFLRFKEGSGCRTVILSTEEGEDVCKMTEKPHTKYAVRSEITIGAYVVQIDEEIASAATNSALTEAVPVPGNRPGPARLGSCNTFTLQKPTSSVLSGFKKPTMFVAPSRTPAAPAEKIAELADSFWEQDCLPTEELPPPLGGSAQTKVLDRQLGIPRKVLTEQSGAFPASGMSTTTSSNRVGSSLQRPVSSKGPVEQDPALMRLMRPHQVVGADFLISRLLGQPVGTSGDLAGEESEDSDGHTPPQVSGITCTGAILADEVRQSQHDACFCSILYLDAFL
jgi:hypothetical protein